MKQEIKIAIVGASGLIGESLLAAIAGHPWLTRHVELLGGEGSVGQPLEFGRQELMVGELALFDFNQVQVVISTGEEQLDKEWLERAQEAGCIVLDIGAQLLEVSDLPPVVASVNAEVLAMVAHGGVVALPDAATTQLITVLKPLIDRLDIERVSVVSCHAISDLGRSGVEEMARQTAQLLNGKPVTPLIFPKQIAFNLYPQVGEIGNNGLTTTEQRIIDHTRRILADENIGISLTCSWVPVFFGHSQAITIQTADSINVDQVHGIFSAFPGINLMAASGSSPTAVTDASGKDNLTLGRIASGPESMTEFSFWTVADNIRFGLAGNAVKVLEVLVKNFM